LEPCSGRPVSNPNWHKVYWRVCQRWRRIEEQDSFFASLDTPAINPHIRGLAEIGRLGTTIRYLTSQYGTTRDLDFPWHILAQSIAANAPRSLTRS
jgi:hypothetical protein